MTTIGVRNRRSAASAPPAGDDDRALVARILAHDETGFTRLVERYNGRLLRLAMSLISSRAVAEEVVQEAWLGVLQGLPNFDWRSSLRTWMYRILINRAITRREREGRTVPFSALGSEDGDHGGEGEQFTPGGKFAAPPGEWDERQPERRLQSKETLAVLEQALGELPTKQRAVVTLRDIEGLDSAEVCNILDISEINQRVLLHRGRTRLRRALTARLEPKG
ncbi:MAG TPA: sigma-70 family RNA polymerase sigma factor [Polyangia bacterium]